MVKIDGYPSLDQDALYKNSDHLFHTSNICGLLVATCVATLSFYIWYVQIFLYELLVELRKSVKMHKTHMLKWKN